MTGDTGELLSLLSSRNSAKLRISIQYTEYTVQYSERLSTAENCTLSQKLSKSPHTNSMSHGELMLSFIGHVPAVSAQTVTGSVYRRRFRLFLRQCGGTVHKG